MLMVWSGVDHWYDFYLPHLPSPQSGSNVHRVENNYSQVLFLDAEMSCLYPKCNKKSQAKISSDILSSLLHFKYRQKSKVSTKTGVETGQYLSDRLRQINTEDVEHESLGCFVQM